jgi:predicted membrane chloride channel (bestrophin family)
LCIYANLAEALPNTFVLNRRKLSHCIGGAERIHQTVVPLNYARHTLRALTLWLFTLPFAIVKDLNRATGPIIFLVAWLLFGVYEIGVRIEDPFQGTLRLSIMCDMVRRDVLGDESIRSTAFELEMEGDAINGEGADEEDDTEEDRDSVSVSKEKSKPSWFS